MAGVTPMPPQMKTRCCGMPAWTAVRYSPLGSSRGLNSPPTAWPLSRGPDMFFLQSKEMGHVWEIQGNKEIFFPMEIHKELQDLYIDFCLEKVSILRNSISAKQTKRQEFQLFFVGNLWNFSLFVSRLLLGWKHEYTEPNWKMSNSHVQSFTLLVVEPTHLVKICYSKWLHLP